VFALEFTLPLPIGSVNLCSKIVLSGKVVRSICTFAGN
jgi:hypothetical protein